MRTKTLGLALIALLALGAVWAAAASAAPIWKIGGVEMGVQQSMEAIGTIEISESYFGYSMSCSFSQQGNVKPGSTGEITGKKVVECTHVTGTLCESAIELEARHLPWKTELVAVDGEVRNEIKSGGGGKPTWELKCNGSLGKEELECTGAETSLGMTNYSGGVKAAYDKSSTAGSCAIGGHETLTFHGSEKVTATGGPLEVEDTQWLLNAKYLEGKTVAVASKGTLKFSDAKATGGKLGVECASSGKWSVGPGVGSELEGLTLSGCKVVENATCKSATVEAQDLPWHSALITSEGATRGLISEDGKGAPGYKITCETLLGRVTDTCTGNTSAVMKVVTGGVDETFGAGSEKLSCSVGGAGQGAIEGTSLLENPSSGTLAFT